MNSLIWGWWTGWDSLYTVRWIWGTERKNSDLGEFSVKKLKLGFGYLGVQSGKVEEGVGYSD